ncbi:FtsK/SpoIIIE domain-containing protein [Couchioplanes azureus]|uniref:FtsK/SpoIIIE domain-containing protein n=2 Tax=Couchioplanes caeruleus TaxID=56438 RepID=UPI0016717A0E|nr:FtsK/SpoIIIE domain-containing protein [Couchioplanes caeruleus]GGQ78492.1 cell division protein FtsK [Couchioplanes caeruleus subsp. azureus]
MATVRRHSFGDFLFSLIGKLLVWVAKLAAKLIARMVVLAVSHPRTTLSGALGLAAVLYAGWRTVALVLGATLIAASTWRVAHEDTFMWVVGAPVRTWWRRWWTYRRQWADVFTRCDLAVAADDEWHPPTLKKVTTTAYWDRLTIRMQIGQDLDQFRQNAEKLRHGFGAQRVAVREIAPALLGLDLMRRDPLLAPVPATPFAESTAAIDWARVPVGRDEFGDEFTISVVGGHTAVAGSSGAGKAGVQWNALRHLAPAIADGTVRLIGIDPKVKELGRARALFAEYAVDEEDVVELLQQLVRDMKAANAADADTGERDFAPAQTRPLHLIVIDELAPLLKYWPRRTRDKIEDSLGLLLTQGRAVGYIVLGAIQEPTKDSFTVRDLFTRRLALRLPTESHTDAALIEKAVDYGARCHEIPESLPGVLFSLVDGGRQTTRARLGHVTDADIDALLDHVRSLRAVVALDTRRPATTSPAIGIEAA